MYKSLYIKTLYVNEYIQFLHTNSFYLDTFDGIHLSPKGHKIIAERFAEIIKNN